MDNVLLKFVLLRCQDWYYVVVCGRQAEKDFVMKKLKNFLFFLQIDALRIVEGIVGMIILPRDSNPFESIMYLSGHLACIVTSISMFRIENCKI